MRKLQSETIPIKRDRRSEIRHLLARLLVTSLSKHSADPRQLFGRLATSAGGDFSVRQPGVHFIGLVNVVNLKAVGLGTLGNEQLEWLEKDDSGEEPGLLGDGDPDQPRGCA